VETHHAKNEPTLVPGNQAKQVRDWAGPAGACDWSWVEGSVWTKRMLEALVNGVKGGVWFSWPNSHFKKLGLFSMSDEAFRLKIQSPCG